MFAVINVDGSFSGVKYNLAEQRIINHHKQYGQALVRCTRDLTIGEDGVVVEVPTESELQSVIEVGEELVLMNYMMEMDFRQSLLELGITL